MESKKKILAGLILVFSMNACKSPNEVHVDIQQQALLSCSYNKILCVTAGSLGDISFC